MSQDRIKATLALQERTTRVRGVSSARAAALSKMGIETVRDLVTHYPRRYIDMSAVATAATAKIGQSCTIAGTIHEIASKRPKKVPLVEITLVDGTGTVIITCFRQPWLAEQFQAEDSIAVSGVVDFRYGFKRMTNPFIERLEGDALAEGRIISVHPATEKISTAWMRRFVGNALEQCAGTEDPLPLGLRSKYRLYSRQSALQAIHFPARMEEVEQARRRLVFEELLLLELYLMRASVLSEGRGEAFSHAVDGPCVQALEAALPFALTREQVVAKSEIFAVLAAERPANHMLLGDVGTGKTIVAGFALAAAADSGTQALMMGPTEVLASQYASSLGPLLDDAGVSWDLLTGSTEPARRTEVLRRLRSGELSVLFGTHALLEPDVEAANVRLVIIDEQQRFGTKQRQTLIGKGSGAADVLSLTATPIPRSLALALYGNTTLSYLKERPANRQGVATHVFGYEDRGDAYELMRQQIEAGHQVFVVCPLVGSKRVQPEDDEEDRSAIRVDIEDELDFVERDPRAVYTQAEILRTQVFPDSVVEVLHGKMPSDEKAQVMESFRAGQVQVLVATTVIEVGVDVPNACGMLVEDADRFGLAQLHQLRGRVGRGQDSGVVCLVSGTKEPAALERLAAMERTEDGFELAEYDLSLRREGDILGNRQHGASSLKLVNVVRDAAVIEQAHACAATILEKDPNLEMPGHAALKRELACVFPPETGMRSS